MQRDSPCTCFNPAVASFTDKIAFPKEQKCRRGGEIERITPRNLSVLLLERRSSCRGFLTALRCLLLSGRRHRLIATVAELSPLACKNRARMHQRQTPAKCERLATEERGVSSGMLKHQNKEVLRMEGQSRRYWKQASAAAQRTGRPTRPFQNKS